MITVHRYSADDCTLAAEGWEQYARESADSAAWDRARGIDLSPPGCSPGDHRARTAQQVAQSLRLEASTGTPHCLCRLRPAEDCPHGQSLTRRRGRE
jgi:hypothetical protein